MQLLDGGDLSSLTTNAVAAKAGISIGTLYQYFDDKQALLDALVAREMGAMAKKVVATLGSAPPAVPGDRVRHILRAAIGTYGGRGRVHRLLLEHALTRAPGKRLSPLFTQLMELFTTKGIATPGQAVRPLTRGQAFVLTHAVVGVLRSLSASDDAPPLREVEEALVQLILGYMQKI